MRLATSYSGSPHLTGQGRAPARARSAQETELARAAAVGLPGTDPAPFLLTASNGPEGDGGDERTPPSLCTFRLATADRTTVTTQPARRRSYAITEGTSFVTPRQNPPHGGGGSPGTQWFSRLTVTRLGSRPPNQTPGLPLEEQSGYRLEYCPQ